MMWIDGEYFDDMPDVIRFDGGPMCHISDYNTLPLKYRQDYFIVAASEHTFIGRKRRKNTWEWAGRLVWDT